MARNARVWTLAVFCFGLMLLSAGCKTELWVRNDGSGRGVLSEVPTEIVNKSDLEAEIRAQGLEILSIRERNGTLEATFAWSDFSVFGTREVYEDGSIYIDIGSGVDYTIIHVPGRIIETTGQKTAPDTVEFVSHFGKASMTYIPQSSFPAFLIWAVVLAAVIVGGTVLLARKKISMPGISNVKAKRSEKSAKYCNNCGEDVSQDASFCGNCGQSVK